MAKRKPIPPRRPGRRPAGVLGAPADRALMLSLVVEMHRIAHDVLLQLGVSADEQEEAKGLARKPKSRVRPSEAMMTTLTGVGDVLSMWRRDKRFTGRDGTPRVLPIRGKGATLETLARTCAPSVPLVDVLAYICSHGEVTLYKDDKVALLGSSAMIAQRTPEMTLAWMLTQFRHIAETTVYNAAIPAKVKGVGLFQRQIVGVLSEKEFRRYAQAIRPQLQELSDQLEGGLSLKGRKKGRGNRTECGVGLFVYRDTGTIG
jgi:hypothetical protein